MESLKHFRARVKEITGVRYRSMGYTEDETLVANPIIAKRGHIFVVLSTYYLEQQSFELWALRQGQMGEDREDRLAELEAEYETAINSLEASPDSYVRVHIK